ncbi:NAD(P)/FAD-dependent oxidoreductase [Salinarimonas soli]|uniref:NAD(P)/FAD-dependent oxidoreductase n=1 Tax=Salinarimonas soli TaxID=1638099 RepID=A0A5B2V670_9HYPH|nr:NAD(P)/FAD-dependent oxidoreductase [Salinarimonas soli]KAA2235023.1 NAD(P)/FAD-dependent oxidoreductase [Salinarimonas soli]
MAESVECVVVGAGVVGLACARALALQGREVLVIDAEATIGAGTSSRNSEVVHAGIYYPQGSLKARLCVAGREALYAYARERGVEARAIGKIIVATDAEQIGTLHTLREAAERNGVHDLRWIDQAEAAELEPEVRCVAGLFSPRSGIVDSHALMLAYQGDLEAHGGMVALSTPILGGAVTGNGIRLETGGAEAMTLDCRLLVNSAGLHAPDLARGLEGFPAEHVPVPYLAKGNYFSLVGVRQPFKRLVYPVPEPGGLGIHATLDLAGQVRFGPDVQWVDRIDYTVDASRQAAFEKAIRTYWPGLPDGALQPSYAGIRPKITPPGAAAADFVVQTPADHGVPGIVNLFGIESPGLTSSLAIADYVASSLEDRRAAA